MSRRLGGLLLALAAVADVRPAAAEVICQRRGGALVVRDTCKRRERAADLSTLGALGPKGAAAPGVRLVDANGKQVGSPVDPFFDDTTVFAYEGGGHVLVTKVTPDVRDRMRFFHESPDCSGARFIPDQGYRMVRYADVSGSTAYFAGDPIASHTFSASESIIDAPDCSAGGGTVLPNGSCCKAESYTGNAGPVATFDLATLGVTAPFHLEVTR